MKGKLIIVVEEEDMDSGCTHAILEECMKHGKVLEAWMEGVNDKGETYRNDIMHETEGMEPGPIMGKC